MIQVKSAFFFVIERIFLIQKKITFELVNESIRIDSRAINREKLKALTIKGGHW